jgi:predicted enzyme related to lactoylglutathione lyase
MPDPFEALRTPIIPVEPEPAFAARLRARVERALSQPRGVTVSELVLDDVTAREATAAEPEARLVPYLTVADGARALAWYVSALGARRRGDPIVMPDGRIGHAELELGSHLLYLSEEFRESHVAAPLPGEDARVTLVLEVADVDAAMARAAAEGAAIERPAADHPYGRNAVIRDPFGHRWMISGPAVPERPRPGDGDRLRQGDLTYASLWVPEVERAADFYGAVLGWTYAPGSSQQGRQVVGSTLHQGLWGGQERGTLFLCFAVDDMDEAIERVRRAGGRAEAPTQEAYGLISMCVDDQGMPFSIHQSPAGDPGVRGPANGTRQGDLSYVTLEVRDSARARAFYGEVLGWRFSPGRVADGWGVDGVVPMTGMQGGHEVARVVPMYLVDDVAAAVERVRAAGGSAPDPERQPYGISAECVDDQGTRFYLFQP